MSNEHAQTGQTFRDGSPVSFPAYRCRATAKDQREAAHSTYTHRCKRPADHEDEKHACICGKTWEPVLA